MDYNGRHIWEIGEPVFFLLDIDNSQNIILSKGAVSEIRKYTLQIDSSNYSGKTIAIEACYPTAEALMEALQRNLKKEYDKLIKPTVKKVKKK